MYPFRFASCANRQLHQIQLKAIKEKKKNLSVKKTNKNRGRKTNKNKLFLCEMIVKILPGFALIFIVSRFVL